MSTERIADGLAARFEQPAVWDIDLQANPFWVEKLRLMSAMIPGGVQTILDLGCGDCRQSELLAVHYRIVGADRSLQALGRAQVPAVCCQAQNLPFADHSFDLVFCSEMIEHLPKDMLTRTIAQMRRVTRDWLLLSVPYQENLRALWMRCDKCRGTFHIYGHIQRFDLVRLQRLLEGWTLHSYAHCGECGLDYHPGLLWVRQVVGRKWYHYAPAHPLCPHCGNRDFAVPFGNRVARWCDTLNERLFRRTRALYPYWVVTLWQRGRAERG